MFPSMDHPVRLRRDGFVGGRDESPSASRMLYPAIPRSVRFRDGLNRKMRPCASLNQRIRPCHRAVLVRIRRRPGPTRWRAADEERPGAVSYAHRL